MTNIIPTNGSTLSSPDRALSLYVSPSILQRMYSIFLWDLSTNNVPPAPNIDPSGLNQTAEYYFSVPPQIHEVESPFAVSVVPTQSASKWTEGFGILSKSFRISGTTGLRPNKVSQAFGLTTTTFKSADTDLATGLSTGATTNPNFQGVVNTPTYQSPGVNSLEFTGHDSIIMLNNMFNLYSDLMREGNTNIVMVWRNVKDDDFWIVEPLNFKISQTSKSPFLYSYNIVLKSLARFDRSLAAISTADAQGPIRGDSGFSARMQQNAQVMATTYYSTLASGDLLQGITNVSTITGPIQTLMNLVTHATTGNLVPAERIIGQAFILKQTLTTNLSKLINLPNAVGKRFRRLERDWRRLRLTCDSILTEKRYQNSVKSYTNRRDRIVRAHTSPSMFVPGSTTLPNTGGSPSFIGNTPPVSSVDQGVVQANDDIRLIAQRYLGDARRWQELVILNELKPPYVSATGEGNTLKPGDAILFPGTKPQVSSTLIGVKNENNQEYDDDNVRASTLLLDQTYGRDLLLSSNESAGGIELTDLVVNQRGDLATVSGIDNVKQAIGIKFATEQGELKCHPYFGARYAIGRKATTSSFNQFRGNTLATFLSDGRIREVSNLVITSVEDTLLVSATAQLVNGNDYINTSFALRRF